MRFLTFSKNGVETVGVRLADEVVDLSLAAPSMPRKLLHILTEGLLREAADAARQSSAAHRMPLTQVRHLPLLPEPPKMVNLIWHADRAKPEIAGMTISVAGRLCGHGDLIVAPSSFSQLDYGIELAVILSKGGRHIAASEAATHIAGYSIFNGGFVRDLPEGQVVAVSRNFDRTAPFGPELVTPDELPSLARGLRMVMRRNGEVVQEGATDSAWLVDEAIARASSYMTLEDGDVLTMGTIAKSVRDDLAPEYLRQGDILEADIEGIGMLRNAVAAEVWARC